MVNAPSLPQPNAGSTNGPSARPKGTLRRRAVHALLYALAVLALASVWALVFPQQMPAAIGEYVETLTGANPHPVTLMRPATAPLSAVALLGKQMFFDPRLSASGQQSCATCHSPQHAYGPPNALPVQPGGAHMSLQGDRAVPLLTYLYRQPNFSIGPDDGEAETTASLADTAAQAASTPRAQKVAGAAPAAPAMVPQGGLFWDGRADTLQAQAYGPLFNPVEMANTDVKTVAAKIAEAPYAATLRQLFGPAIFNDPARVVSEAMFAIARYQVEDPSFHPYTSKYDYWLEGKVRLTRAEIRGLHLFTDKNRANCAGCHLATPGKDGLPPMFTDFQYEALGVPRNRTLAVNHDPAFHDMGVCGPHRTDLSTQTQYCGMFLTPSLRNAATRQAFFHNGVYHSLEDVMKFYNLRDTDPGKIYPRGPDGKIVKYDDLPERFHANIDVTDAPFDRHFGEPPAMSDADIKDIIAFLKTLDDGYPLQTAQK
ncbi:cytochrome-c peroxidase [Paraburkholderia kururiensis]|uniref:cytochrome-c peroxidase n=1 Tax=Paraburkholderia kururiensis TaxID=984307 RepID=UPI0018F63E70|nr:cytochrome c peroxidase [Paraburkholderia kururiensis]